MVFKGEYGNNGPSPRKRPRFFIEDILNNNFESQNQIGSGSQQEQQQSQNQQQRQQLPGISCYAKRLETTIDFDRRFKSMKSGSRFIIENIPDQPENLLRLIFNDCIDKTFAKAKEKDIKPDHIGAIISSQLLDRDIYIPIRKYQIDTVDNILNEFLKVSQSKTDRGSLWGEPFNIIIHAIGVSQLPRKRTLRGTAPSVNNMRHQENFTHLIKVTNNGDNLCLFYSLELTRMHDTNELGNRLAFCRYHRQRPKKQREDIIKLMNDLNIPMHEKEYDAYIYIPIIVN